MSPTWLESGVIQMGLAWLMGENGMHTSRSSESSAHRIMLSVLGGVLEGVPWCPFGIQKPLPH